MMSRRFVLQPLVDVAPDLVVEGQAIQDALDACPAEPAVVLRREEPAEKTEEMYASLAIEGGIGAGKTTFSTWLAQDLGAELMLERFEENPFLEKFYENPEAHAFSVELSFLADRYKQMQGAIKSRNLQAAPRGRLQFREELDFRQGQFAQGRVQAVQHHVPNDGGAIAPAGNHRHPRSGTFWQEAQIVQRGRDYEQNLPEGYLDRVAKGYEAHYRHHRGARVLWVDTSALDFVARPEELTVLRDAILTPRKPGVHRIVARP